MIPCRCNPLALVFGFLVVAALPWPAQGSTPAPWIDPGWGYRIECTVQPDSLPAVGTLVDFPLLLSLNGMLHASVFNRAKADGSDLLVTEGDGMTVLDREIVGYDAASMKAEIWIRTNALTRTTNRFYLYYGNPDTTLSASPAGTWSPEYRAVYHFKDDPGAGVLSDSSPQGVSITLDPVRGWTSADTTSAQIHQGWFFNGSTHYLSNRFINTQDSSYVISTWLLNTAPSIDFVIQANPGFWHLSSQTNASTNQPEYLNNTSPARVIRFFPNPIPINDGYHLFSWVFDGVTDTLLFYFDGEPQAVHSIFPDTLTVYTGEPINPLQSQPVGILSPMFFNPDDLMTGGADEFRIREGVLSADWIKTEYRNQKDPIGFYGFGPEEGGVTAVGHDPGRSSILFLAQNTPNPFREYTSIRFSLEALSPIRLSVYDVAGREVARLVDAVLGPGLYETRWNGAIRNGRKAPSGVYFLRLEAEREVASVKIQRRR